MYMLVYIGVYWSAKYMEGTNMHIFDEESENDTQNCQLHDKIVDSIIYFEGIIYSSSLNVYILIEYVIMVKYVILIQIVAQNSKQKISL